MFNVYSIENQNFYLNNILISGIQNINISYDNNIIPSLGIEDNNLNYFVSKPIIANMDLDYLLSAQDQFIKYTGSNYFNGKIEYGNNYFTLSSGYLTNYSIDYQLGNYPKVNIRALVLGELGNDSGKFIYSPKNLNEFKIGDNCYVDLNLNESNFNRLESFNLNIDINREAVYTIGRYLPENVIIKYPINISLNFEFSMSDYLQQKITNIFNRINPTGLSLSFKEMNSNNNLLNLNFSNLINSQTEMNYSINSESKLKLSFNTYILSGI